MYICDIIMLLKFKMCCMRGLRMGMLSAKKNIFTWAKGSRNYIEYKRLKRIRKQNIPA